MILRLLFVFVLVSTSRTESDFDPMPKYPAAREFLPTDQLLLVQVVWRHGDRAPTMTYPTDIHRESAWPQGWGELTPLGMRQQYSLGRVLHNRYINVSVPFISPRYNAKEVYIRSTDVNRTLISAQANLAGMFPHGKAGKDFPEESHSWPSHWTPIPIHTLEENRDHAGNVFAPCKRAEQVDTEMRRSPEYLEFEKESKNFLDFLSEKTGQKIDLTNIFLINDAHHIELIYNLSQPAWLTEAVSQHLRNVTERANTYTYGIGKPYVPELIKLRGGSLLKELIERMNNKYSCHQRNSTEDDCKWLASLKYYAYSAHDTTVAALLTTFGDEQRVIRGGMPKYTASVAIELWHLEDIGPAVKILFHGAFHHNYHVITHLTKGCPIDNEFCPLEVFKKRSAKFLPVDIAKECAAKRPTPEETRKHNLVKKKDNSF